MWVMDRVSNFPKVYAQKIRILNTQYYEKSILEVRFKKHFSYNLTA
jgi:hypothetical protein